jgi:hypothetical protein
LLDDCGCRVRGSYDLYELEMLLPTFSARAAPTASCGTRSTASFCVLSRECRLSYFIYKEEYEHQMRKKRGGDTLPPPLSSAWNSDRRSVLPAYLLSFGDTPITLTPDPRATSIAKITS